jgi:pimeloyl-ACP methyl ester carboxylesterase
MTFNKDKRRTRILFILGIVVLLFLGFRTQLAQKVKHIFQSNTVSASSWYSDYDVVEINSSVDNTTQKAIVFKSSASEKQPVVVSLHTWSATFDQNDYIHQQVKANNWNYIHPDFRGANNTYLSCASDFVIADIDDAISYAISHLNADPQQIYLVGVSGGGYATLAMFMKSKYAIASFAAWCPITDLKAWYYETKAMNLEFSKDILNCTNSTALELNEEELIKRSPLHWNATNQDLNNTQLKIYAGVYDGIDGYGSVPITHAINFYNKVLEMTNCELQDSYVKSNETDSLLKNRKAYNTNTNDLLGSRKIILKKQYKNISLTIFDGGHEILTDVAINELEKS